MSRVTSLLNPSPGSSAPAPPSTRNDEQYSFPIPPRVPSEPLPLQRPKCLLTFSYNANHELEFNNSAMKYFSPPPAQADLNWGYDRWVHKEEGIVRLDSLLQATLRDEARYEAGRAHLVTWRGIMTKIMMAPYEERDSWDLNLMYLNGTMYLEENLTEQQIQAKGTMTAEHRTMSYYGYAFESYCTSSSPSADSQAPNTHPEAPPGWGGDVNTNVQWCQIVKTKLNSHRLILGGEVDCVRDSYNGTTENFVELKTSLVIKTKPDRVRFEKKLLKFWAQSFLLGVPEILVGYRFRSGIVEYTESFRTLDIPQIVRGKGAHAWDAGVCLNFADAFLNFLDGIIATSTNDPRLPLWRISFLPRKGIMVRRLHNRKEVLDVQGGGDSDRVGILPTWFWNHATGTSNNSEN
ncbi:hypothetical protein BOTBODRAFT_131994 [Botryobasidium botryosum FD-172 SS1]|uniref:Decapping nuclease n=1 Tax=Botryobasidium botryosum (strain FD-172 SS1) TaxID=930990 RepID=A0A067MTT0_BOTB1|nr:hypothetical protein BOTBODRAFT_131994 [Botryobasidium botryosum FD-172 SS1]